MTDHTTGTREEWLAARELLLVRAKEHTRLGDELAQLRRDLPRVRLEKEYRLDTDDGLRPLGELFDGRSQLLVYHFMFGPSYEAGCPVNSSIADAVDGVVPHLHARDVTFVLASQAPLEKLQAYKRRMGWSVPWVSSGFRGLSRCATRSCRQPRQPADAQTAWLRVRSPGRIGSPWRHTGVFGRACPHDPHYRTLSPLFMRVQATIQVQTEAG